MKCKKILSLLISGALICSTLTSCSVKSDVPHKSNNKSDENNPSIVTGESDQVITDEPEISPEVNEPQEKVNGTISVLTGHYTEQEWSDSLNKRIANVTYPVISLEEPCAQMYPELNQALNSLSEERKNVFLTEYKDLIFTAKEDAKGNSEYFDGYTSEEKVLVRRADTKTVSLLFQGYSYTGGAHGNSYFSSMAYDSKSGQPLELTDVLKDTSNLPSLVKEALYSNYGTDEFYGDLDLTTYFTGTETPITWTLDYSGITFYFNPYEIGPYSSGSFFATLTYGQYPELFKEEYLELPKSYGISIPSNMVQYIDLDGDGTVEQLSVYSEGSDYYSCEKVGIRINEAVVKDTLDAYSMESVLLHTADNKNYLYVESTGDNDYKKISVFDLTGAKAVAVDFTSDGFFTPHSYEDFNPLKQIPTNPEEFILETRTEYFSTVSGYKTYSVGSNGMPKSNDTFYTLHTGLTFTLRKPLKVTVIDEKTCEALETKTLEPGTKLDYYRTDNETYGDFRLQDDTVVRVSLDSTQWPRTIDGVNLEDIFEGLLFAG